MIADPARAGEGRALERCVGEVGPFLHRHWQRTPLYRAAATRTAFDDLLTLADVDRILTERGLRFPALRLVADGQTVPSARYTKTLRIQSRAVDDFIDVGRVYALFGDGATIVLQALHRHWAPLTHFCRDLELELTHPVQCNVYLTPPRARGLDVHYDTHDVFVLQVSGTKLWKVYGAAVELPLAHQRRTGTFESATAPQIDVELQPGDCLYIPRGFLHAAETAARESAHMTIGILTYRWMDVMDAVMKRAGEEAFSKEALPVGFAHSPEDLETEIKERLGRVAEWLQGVEPSAIARTAAERFWASRAPALGGQLQQLLALSSLDDRSLVRRRRGATCRLRVEDDELVVVLGDRRLHMPGWVAPAVEHIVSRPELEVAELEPHLDTQSRLTLVRRLIEEGLLEQVGG